METGLYDSPLVRRYASPQIMKIFSDDTKFSTWRRLWVALAEAEQQLGIAITDEQIAEMRANIDNIDYEYAQAREREVRHDVMAHVLTYGHTCPSAAGIIHLGATSCYVGDNTDILVMRDALIHTRDLLVQVLRAGCDFAQKYADLPSLAYTHFQPAQPTTLGKRATLWLQDLVIDLDNLEYVLNGLRLLGCKGTTGTGASFLELFGGDAQRVQELEQLIAAKFDMQGRVFAVSGQTYTRKVDYSVLSVLSGIAQSATKFSSDIRLMSHLKEVDEPFESKQIGSSAMAYKRNPMRSERIASLSRYVINDVQNAAMTTATQWLERTLDDSAVRRLSIPEGFLAIDAVLNLYLNILRGMRVYDKMFARHLRAELPFMITENILMLCVSRGGDRQVLHEAIRKHSVAAAQTVKNEGLDNDLLDRIAADSTFGLTRAELEDMLDDPTLVGLAPLQTAEYVSAVRDRITAYTTTEDGGTVLY